MLTSTCFLFYKKAFSAQYCNLLNFFTIPLSKLSQYFFNKSVLILMFSHARGRGASIWVGGPEIR